jgi:c-di-GMP-binding flagellar brake protein YcgR
LQVTIPPQTLLTLTVQVGDKSVDYVCTVLGFGRFGLRVTLPQILNQTYTLPVKTLLTCTFVPPSGNQLLAFKSYVMGYERLEPPCMVIAPPQTVEEANRRNARRYQVELPVHYIAEGEQVYGEHTRSIDLSLDGIRIHTGRLLKPGSAVSIGLSLPDEEILLSGIVIWSTFKGRRAMAGIQFTRMKEAIRASLAKFLAGLERQQRPSHP